MKTITKITQIFFLLAISNFSFSQIGIKATNTAPHPSAMLDVESTTKGMLVPRMTTGQRTLISNLTPGLLVYDTDINSFFFYNGTAWQNLSAGGGGGNSQWNINGNNIYNTNVGNVGIGTVSATAPLSFGNSLGNKINFYGNANIAHYGVGLQGSLLQFYNQENTADIAFGIGNSGVFTENMRIKGDGNVNITGTINNEALSTPTLINGWVNSAIVGDAPARFFKDKAGIVHLSGRINTTNLILGGVIFTLPVGYRPTSLGSEFFSTVMNTGPNVGVLRIWPQGDVELQFAPGLINGSQLLISLSGISFRAN